MMNKELVEIKSIIAIHFGALGFLNPSENEQILKDRDKVLNYLSRFEPIDNVNPSEALEIVRKYESSNYLDVWHPKFVKGLQTVEQALLKAQEQEKENEILKEIIKTLFDKGCPLHQYTDKDLGLTIEADNEHSTMHLGEFKGVDLDKKLKEVLEWEK